MPNYNKLEDILQRINAEYIALNDEDVAHNNSMIRKIIDKLVVIMKDDNTDFKTLYQELYYDGSFYDGLKVKKPDEYDINLVLNLGKCKNCRVKKCGCIEIEPSDVPGYFWFKLSQQYCTELKPFIKDGHVQSNLIFNWFKSMITRALNKLKNIWDIDDFEIIQTPPTYLSESEPVIILQLTGKFGKVNIDIAPSFIFTKDFWPTHPFRGNSTDKPNFFLIPRSPHHQQRQNRYWQCCFSAQERQLIAGKEKLKPSLRLLKTMRNNLTHKLISSYAMTTMVLWEADKFNWLHESLSNTFMKLLKDYRDNVLNCNIPYYWNEEKNLIGNLKQTTLENHGNEIANKISKIDREFESNPFVIVEVIFRKGSREYDDFMSRYSTPTRSSNHPTPQQALVYHHPSYERPRNSGGQATATVNNDNGLSTIMKVGAGVGVAAVATFALWRSLSRSDRD